MEQFGFLRISLRLQILAILEKHSDSDVFQFLNYFTDLNSKDINELKNSNKDINELKIILANEVTKICHSEKDSKNAEKEAIFY